MNYYSGFLLGLLLICSSLFYGLALTSSDKKYHAGSTVLDGSWRLVSQRYLDPQGNVLHEESSKQLTALKIVANRHFSIITTRSDGTVLNATAGRFELDEKQYREMPELATQQDRQTKAYQWRLVNGQWYQSYQENNRVIEQIWQLIEQN